MRFHVKFKRSATSTRPWDSVEVTNAKTKEVVAVKSARLDTGTGSEPVLTLEVKDFTVEFDYGTTSSKQDTTDGDR
ncbi:MAG: hypothetical protein AB7G11_02730 [Phycisphaerales bacterium]